MRRPLSDRAIGAMLVTVLVALAVVVFGGVANRLFERKGKTVTAVFKSTSQLVKDDPVRVHGVSQFPIYKQLGAGIYMMRVNWWTVAPTRPAHPADPNDPAYEWPADTSGQHVVAMGDASVTTMTAEQLKMALGK